MSTGGNLPPFDIKVRQQRLIHHLVKGEPSILTMPAFYVNLYTGDRRTEAKKNVAVDY